MHEARIIHSNSTQLRKQITDHLNDLRAEIESLQNLVDILVDGGYLLLESGTTDRITLEDGSGFLLLESGSDLTGVVLTTTNQTIDDVKTFTSDPIIPDEAYGVGWNGVLEPPTKNAVYDKIELLAGATLEPWKEADSTPAMGGRYAYYDISSASPTFTLPSAFTAVDDADTTRNEIWVWNANAATVFVVKITPASGDQIYLNGVTLETDRHYNLQPGELAILAPIANNASWSMTVVGRRVYTPAMMKYDGSADNYTKASVSTSGNLVTVVGEFRCLPRAGSGARWLLAVHGGTLNSRRVNIQIGDTSNSAAPEKLIFLCRTASTFICNVSSGSNVTDGLKHTYFLEFDGDAGTTIFCLDGITTGHTVVTSTTGTLNSGSYTIDVGYSSIGAGSDYNGELGFFGYKDDSGLDLQDFVTAQGRPLELDEITWAEWGGQPIVWNPHGQLERNLGSAGAFTKNGTVTPVAQFGDKSAGLFLT